VDKQVDIILGGTARPEGMGLRAYWLNFNQGFAFFREINSLII